MRLYHFTTANRIPLIREQGLRAMRNAEMGCGLPIVALTALPSTAISEKDRLWLIRNNGADLAMQPTWLAGSERRLAVDIVDRDRLFPFRDFLRWLIDEGKKPMFDPSNLSPLAKRWFVYGGDIAPSVISDWDCTEGAGVTLWPRTDPTRIELFDKSGFLDTGIMPK